MRIVHISDFHIDEKNINDLKEFVIKPLVNDLVKFNNERKIDMIAFSGDLVDKGGMSFGNDIELGFLSFHDEVMEPLLEAINLPRNRFFIVPGNHDVVQNEDDEVTEEGLKAVLKNSQKVNSLIDSGETNGIKRILPFKKFERDYYQDFDGEIELTSFESTFNFSVNNLDVGITCFNTSWRSRDSKTDNKNLILGERQITRSRKLIEHCDIKIGILHHPLDELAPFESKQVESMLIKNYDLLLFGHIHEGSNWTKTNMLGSTISSVSPSNWTLNVRNNDISYANGYSIIDYNKPNVEITHRRYSHLKESFVSNTDLGDDNGKTVYQLPSSAEIQLRNTELNIIENIKEVHIELINQHLISYNTDTLAPKKIVDMFVLPRIVQKEEEKINDEIKTANEKRFTIEEICNSKDNLLLVGVKESGKTILMDKALIELIENYSNYNKIPVFIDFANTSSNNIETLISKYLNIGIIKVRNEVLKNHNIILLVDNIRFERKYKQLLNNLELFIKENPNVTVLATCTSNIEGELPIEALEYKILELLKPTFIKSFRTKEIKQLMEKWFSKNEKLLNRTEELEKIITALKALNIARTPLAVSMFLWIIEKQENYAPVNNAQMLENFLERLFAKTTYNDIYSSEFNYKNKERLLTEIALYMYKEDQPNYRVSYQELSSFIYNNLKVKMFDFEEESLLVEFIKKGIFTLEKEGINRFIRFKFKSFFQYFLMKNIDINKDFKEHVFSEDYFLHFVDELDYYSGLKMDDVELLALTIERMEKEYSKILSKIKDLHLTYDNSFETLYSVVGRLNNDDIKRITSNSKQTDEDIEKQHDMDLEEIDNTKIDRKNEEINPIERLDRLWILAAKVLKNTEEVKVENLKSTAMEKIILCSMGFATIYKFILSKYIDKRNGDNNDDKDDNIQVEVLSKFLPYIHQVVVYQTMGTGKLNIVLQQRIESIIRNQAISDFEKFIYVFVYADLKGKNRMKYMKLLIQNIKRHYIKDMILMKILEYYYRKDTTSVEEESYKNLIGDLVTIEDGELNTKRDFHRKGKVISRLENSKKEKKLLGSLS